MGMASGRFAIVPAGMARRDGIGPTGLDGHVISLNSETGERVDSTPGDEVFGGQPIKGATAVYFLKSSAIVSMTEARCRGFKLELLTP
jgi:hypothetical protein